MKIIIVGSAYFFKNIEGFRSKDVDRVILVDNPVGFNYVRQTSGSGSCLFEWRKMSADDFVDFTLKSKVPMSIGKFLVKEFCDEIGFTIDHLKQLASVVDRLDDKHKYEKIIYEAIIKNDSWELTEEQLNDAYSVYQEHRKENKEGEE
jgi:hypothetical protein